MWPLDLPAHEVLRLPGETIIVWAVFDWHWYLGNYPEVAAIAGDHDPLAVLEYYKEFGQQQGHSPNRMFDEQWHRKVYPQIVERIDAGLYRSAFDAYCRRGVLDRSAHWLFDEQGYRDRYPNLTDDVLAASEISNGYDHYLRHGAAEDRIGHVLFDPSIYLSNFGAADAIAIRQNGVLQHYLDRIELGEPELRTSIYFDPAWYLKRYPEVVRDVEAKRWKCALHHYLCNDSPTAFDPLPSFSESWYLGASPSLLDVIKAGSFRNGYMHFLRFGAGEMRAPTASIDLVWYAAQPSVRIDLEQARAPDAYAHWLAIGAPSGFPAAKPATETVTSSQGSELFNRNAAALLPIGGRFGYDFEFSDEAIVSVIMAVGDGFAATMGTIASLRSSTRLDIELIIIDLASEDETRWVGGYVPGAKVLRFEDDIGWSRAAEAGRQLAGTQALLLLSSKVQIAPGSVERACARLAADSSVGAVGGMILQAHGPIAQAGGILWDNGDTHDYQRDASPLGPEANFVRDVDFCAPSFLLVRAQLLAQLNGLDHCCTAGYAAVDLCLRIKQAGFRVVYDPSVMIVLGDPYRLGEPDNYFLKKHVTALTEQFAPDGSNHVFARQTGAKPHRILFVEDTVPLGRIGSGFVRSNDLLWVMASLGYGLTVFPVNACDHDLAHVYGDVPESVEVMHTLSWDRLAAFLESRPKYYDTVWVARPHNLAKLRPIVARLTAEGSLKARIILDTEAITPCREEMQATLSGNAYDLQSAMQVIRDDAEICQQVVAVTQGEAEVLRRNGFPHVSVIGHMIDPHPTTRPFSMRSGMLFIGAIHNQDSPNFDSLVWFVDQVLPLIEAELQWETKLTIAGYLAPCVDLRCFDHHPRITLHGPLAELNPLYDSHRVFVAPTRYAAGAPYKVLEAASRGLPVVATEVLREQLGWIAGLEIIAAAADDAAGFAAGVVALYRDNAHWATVRDHALRRVREENGREDYVEAVASVLNCHQL